MHSLGVAAACSAMAVASLLVARFGAMRVRRAWHGDVPNALPVWGGTGGPEVNRRSFAMSMMLMVAAGPGWALYGIGRLTGNAVVIGVGLTLLGVSAVLGVPTLIAINTWNRPRFLVPPPFRAEPGLRAVRKQRKQRRRAGEPDTEHTVEILEVHPLPTDADQYAPYYVAVCSNDDCRWTSDVVDLGDDPVAAEQKVRREAAKHSSVITGPRRPLG